MLDSTKIIRYIEKNLGYKFTELELSQEDIINDIRHFTLGTYSKYFPYITSIDGSELKKVDNRTNYFSINSPIEILSVNRIVTGNMLYVDPTIPIRSHYSQDIFSTVMASDMSSMTRNPITFKFYPPNELEIYPSYMNTSNLLVYINGIHPDHFGTIPANMEEQFLQMALLDTKISLYQIRHRFSNLQTAYGNIELFIDDLADAESQMKELIETFRKNAPKQANRKRLFVF